MVEVLSKDSHVQLGWPCSLLRTLFGQCLVKEQDGGRRKELDEVPLLWTGSCVNYASLPKDKSSSKLATHGIERHLGEPMS